MARPREKSSGFSAPSGTSSSAANWTSPPWTRNEANDELFFVEEERHVRADNTFSFKSIRFEAPRHLPERTIQVRFQRKDPLSRLIVYYKGERLGEARRLDPVANDRKPINASTNQAVSQSQPNSPAQ